MNIDPATNCPHCAAYVAQARAEGRNSCPGCGADISQRIVVGAAGSGSATRFWTLLLLPAAVSLGGFLLGLTGKGGLHDAGIAIGFANCALGLGCSIYCGVWLARRFCPSPTVRALGAVGFTLAVIGVNLFIVAAGCVPTVMSGADFR